MKRIGIDARLYFQTGVGVYIRNLLHYLHGFLPDSWEVVVYCMSQDTHEFHQYSRFIVKKTHAKWHTLTEQTLFLHQLYEDKLDCMHFTYFSYPVWYTRPFVATVHDLTPLNNKTGKASTLPPLLYELKHMMFRYVLRQQVTAARCLFTPTRAVKDELFCKYNHLRPEKIITLHEGLSYEFKEFINQKGVQVVKRKKPYLLSVGNFYPHKNVERLVEAYAGLHRPDIELMFVGPQNYFSNALKEFIATKHIQGVIFYHPSSIEQIWNLYRGAIGVVNASVSEGFGLPLIEAAQAGCPIAASDIEVFHELLGDQYVSFDPYQIRDITRGLMALISQQGKTVKYIIAKDFSFEVMVKKYIDVMKQILS